MSSDDNKSTKAERDAAAQAVLDNMARLKALRLAREAVSPTTAKKAATKSSKSSGTKSSGPKSAGAKAKEKAQALTDWLASQQSGGRRI